MRATEVMRCAFATVKTDTTLIDAARLLLETNQRGLPVLGDDGELIGIISEGDLLHRDELGVRPPAGNWFEQMLGVEEGGPIRERMRALRVGTIMTPDPVCVDQDATVDDVITKMDVRRVGQIPVISAVGRVIGIVSRVQLISALERSLKTTDRSQQIGVAGNEPVEDPS
jgi:CBS domain-containing protein